VERSSELNATHVDVLRVKAGLLSSSKAQAREVKHLNRMVGCPAGEKVEPQD
jgi:hypothetical protein